MRRIVPGILGGMLRQAAAPVGLTLAGIVVLLATHSSTAGIAAATMLIGCACVVAVSLVFLAVGRSEDAERAARQPPPPPPADPHEGEAARRSRPRPPRRPL
jgi:hypothetical protein